MNQVEEFDNQGKVLSDAERRKFLDKFGKLSATIPVSMFVLMGPTQSKANSSDDTSGGTNDSA